MLAGGVSTMAYFSSTETPEELVRHLLVGESGLVGADEEEATGTEKVGYSNNIRFRSASNAAESDHASNGRSPLLEGRVASESVNAEGLSTRSFDDGEEDEVGGENRSDDGDHDDETKRTKQKTPAP
mmetsp:Transcript_57890/g.113926  ORF Transcript_57890/g.113926 Transcript_57890/m.113926 type:complete len:127 (+) Transcript_57890:37-417(+)